MNRNLEYSTIGKAGRTVVEEILSLLPSVYRLSYMSLPDESKGALCEIRIRDSMPSSFTVGNANIAIRDSYGNLVVSCEREIEEICLRFCQGSLYSYKDTIRKGYVYYQTARIGISGITLCESGRISNIKSITSLNIRIPRNIIGAADEMLEYIEKYGIENSMGVVAISLPGVGKTTFLKALAKGLAHIDRFALRTCIADERQELYSKPFYKDCLCDVISGCTKAEALEIAKRSLSSQVIICDEIGNRDEAKAIFDAHVNGIYIASSFHASCAEELMRKEYMRGLIDEGVFKTVYLLERKENAVIGRIIPAKQAFCNEIC